VRAVVREPDEALPATVTEENPGGAMTVLRTLVAQRHLRTPKAFRAQFLRAASELADRESDREFGRLDVSDRQFCRWLDGAQPRPYACRVLEYMFGRPVGELLQPGGLPEPPESCPEVGSEFGSLLRSLREERRLSLRRLGRLVHYSHGYLWDLERGRKGPTGAVVSALDTALRADGRLLAVAGDVLAPTTEPESVETSETVAVPVPGGASIEVRVFVGADGVLPAVPVGESDVVVQAGSVRVLIGPRVGAAPAAAKGPEPVAVPPTVARVYSLDAARRHRLGQAG
jgi:transcriptional regulator with XRE-family HTH domain